MAWTPCAYALNPTLDISQYAHTAWNVRDGFVKGQIYALAQTRDGYFWIGTDRGLFRFDGIKAASLAAVDQKLPSEWVKKLLGTRDGSLWIGTMRGLVRWDGKTLVRYDQLAGRDIIGLVEDRDGIVWVASGRDARYLGLCRIERDRVQCDSEDVPIEQLFAGKDGALWGSVFNRGLWRLKPGPRLFYPLPSDPEGFEGLSEDDDGTLLLSRSGGVFRVVNGRLEMRLPLPSWLPSSAAVKILRDRDGGLWIGTQASGLVHAHGGITDVYTQADGLSGDQITGVFEDREGSIWVATNAGLDRFREVAGTTLRVRQGLANPRVVALAASSDGSVWAASVGALQKLRSDEITTYRERKPQASRHEVPLTSRPVREVAARWAQHLTAVFQDRRGRTWVGGSRGVGYLENDRLVAVAGLPGLYTRAILEDRDRLWVVNDEHGLFGVSPAGVIVEAIQPTVTNHRDPITAAAADPRRSGLWLGFLNGGLLLFDEGRVRAVLDSSSGLGAGTIRHLVVDRDATVWAATEGGLSRVRDGRVATLTHRDGLPCDTILWFVEDDTRALWMTTRCGMVRISRDEIDRWIEKGGPVQTTVFDESDGIRTYAEFFPYTAPVVKSADGRLWFLSPDGVGVVDPHRIPDNRSPPPVFIEQVTADRQPYDVAMSPSGVVRLPPLTRALQIDYTALSLVAPERMVFRYKLENRDADWQTVGTRRQAFYENLPPGTYRFRVTASNNSGVWNETGASLDFSVDPAYYQTARFRVLSVGIIVALVWTAHRVRLRVVEKHEGEISALNERLMKAQEQERMRIAGELHDGVMQEMLSVTMMLGSAKRRVTTNPSEATATIEKVQEKLIQAGADIRQLSHGLHPPILQEAGLAEAVRSYCEEFNTAREIAVTCEADESVRDLSRGAALALFRVLQEALGNAAKHANASRIDVRLSRANDLVSLAVSDNGHGFDTARLGTSGGLGLVMMRERASQLNGTFEFESAAGRGTTIRVVIPFR